MACLTIADLYQEQLDGLVTLAGTRVTYYPVVLQGYSTATQSRSPAESASVEVSGIFGEERVTAPEGAITYATTFTISSAAHIRAHLRLAIGSSIVASRIAWSSCGVRGLGASLQITS